MAQLEAEVSLIETMIERLVSRRARLQGRMNALSPICQLSPEILVKIFQMTCYLSEDSNQHITPLFFGGICKDWREIAWSTPLLWNTISVKVWRRRHATQISLLGEWLQRAQSSPLSIKLTSDDESDKTIPTSGCFRPVMELLITRAEYWQTFDCVLPPRCHDVLLNHNFPLLTSVSLRPPTIGPMSTSIRLPNMFLWATPRLVHVDLSGYDFSAMLLPLGQLQRFKIDSLIVSGFFELLRLSRALKECYLGSVYPGSSKILQCPPSQMLFHSDLEILDVLLVGNDGIRVLDNLNLPKLRVLSVRGREINIYPENRLFDTISSLVLRSSCHLERLSIEQISGIKDDAILACLETIPLLTHLRLEFYLHATEPLPSIGFTDELVSRLCPSQQGQGSSYLLPRLASLEYQGPVPCHSHLLVDMLSKRWHHVSHSEGSGRHGGVSPRLTRAKIDAAPIPVFDIPSDVRDDIVMLVSEGMELEIQ